jgi:hypothetical protein
LLTTAFFMGFGPPILIDGRGIYSTDMRCREQDLNVGQQTLIRGSKPHDLFSFGASSV